MLDIIGFFTGCFAKPEPRPGFQHLKNWLGDAVNMLNPQRPSPSQYPSNLYPPTQYYPSYQEGSLRPEPRNPNYAPGPAPNVITCLLYTSDAADE